MADPLALAAPVARLNGVGEKVAEHLAKLRITRIGDLLFHLPLRYQDRTRLTPIGALRLNREAQIEGQIEVTQVVFGRRRALVVRIADGSGALNLRFFHFNAAQQQRLAVGRRVRCYGEVRRGPNTLEMVHPECQILAGEEAVAVNAELTPIYPTTEGLQQNRLRHLTNQALALLAAGDDDTHELLPQPLLERLAMPSLRHALEFVHRPPPDADVEMLAERSESTRLNSSHLRLSRMPSSA